MLNVVIMGVCENKEEIWRDIPGFPSYQASSLGNIRSAYRTQAGRDWKVLTPHISRGGYKSTSLRNGNKERVQTRIHYLVMLAFIGPCPEGYCRHHKDNDKLNNRPSNLEYKLIGEHHQLHHPKMFSYSEIAELRYLYMNHEHNLDKLGKLMGASEAHIRVCLADLIAKYGKLIEQKFKE
jgi:hypothetical protein